MKYELIRQENGKLISDGDIYNYSIDFLANYKIDSSGKYDTLLQTKIAELSAADLVYMMRNNHSYRHILILLLLDQLDEKDYNYSYGDQAERGIVKDMVNELVLVTDSLYWITDKRSHQRLCKHLERNKYAIKKEYREHLESLTAGIYQWTAGNEQYIKTCFADDVASSYGGAAGLLKHFKRGCDKGLKFYTDKNVCIETHDDFMQWVKTKFNSPTLTGLVEKEKRIIYT